MKRITAIIASFALTAFAALSLAGPANAAGETTEMNLLMPSAGGSLFKEAAKPVNWRVETQVNAPGATILPMKNANLTMPQELSFTPDPDMPVCGDDKIGPPPTNVSITVPEAIERCPDSIIGNGLATFALAQQTALGRDGVMIVFNGGLQNGNARLKVYAYSYDTGVGLYTEAVLQDDGSLDFAIPQLTADSSVTSLNLNIPGETTSLFVASQDITVTLPPGDDPLYAQATCKTNSWSWGGEFLLGQRDTLGNPTSPTTTLTNSGATDCVGATGKGKFANLKIKGPASVKKGKKGTYKVKVKNTGTATAKSVKLKVTGKGVSGKASGGNIAPGKSKTIKVKVKFAKKGKIKTTFKVTGKQASAKTGKKTIRVK